MVLNYKYLLLVISLIIFALVLQSCINTAVVKRMPKVENRVVKNKILFSSTSDTIEYCEKTEKIILKIFNNNKIYRDSILYIFADNNPRLIKFNDSFKSIKEENHFVFGLPFYGHNKIQVVNINIGTDSLEYKMYDCMAFRVKENKLITTEKELLCDTCTFLRYNEHIYKLWE